MHIVDIDVLCHTQQYLLIQHIHASATYIVHVHSDKQTNVHACDIILVL